MSLLRAALVIALAGSATPALAERITCESRLSGAEPCGTIAAGSTVRLSRQLSSAKCIEGRTWGTGPSNDSIWVSGGCRAVFDVQPPNGQADQDSTLRYNDRAMPPASMPHASDPQRSSSDLRRSSGKPEWERGYADAQRGSNFEDRANSADYRAGFQAGRDEGRNDERVGDARDRDEDGNGDDGDGDDGKHDNDQGYDEREAPVDRRNEPRPEGRHDGSRYASADRLRAHARHACVDQATASRSFGRDDVNTTDVRWLGHGMFEVSLDTPDGPITCTVDRDGNIRSMSGD
jgi:hypothetical protein